MIRIIALQRRASSGVLLVHAGLELTEQEVNYLYVSLRSCSMQSRRAVSVLRVYVGAALQETLNDLFTQN